MSPATDPVALLREVLDVLGHHGLDTALIGAGALAVHGYIRATADLDVAVTSSLDTLRRVAADLRGAGADVTFDEPDADDHLGGVLTVTRPSCNPIQVVNFVKANPDADLAAVDDVCARFDLSAAWQALRPRRP